MKTQFIVNPHSGRNRRRPWLAGVIRDFARSELEAADVAVTEAPGHATELARAAVLAGAEVVVAVGGDGTMNEVAQALVQTPAALALVPCGSGNGLALHLGLPRSLERALGLIGDSSRKITAIDTGCVNDRPFFNAMGIGFDAEVSQRFNALTRRGLPAYVRAGFGVLSSANAQRCAIVCGDRRIELDALLVAIANSDQYGNNARIAPGAHVDDGMLDLVAVRKAPAWKLAALVPTLFLGTFDRSPHVLRLAGSAFTLERSAPGLLHTDGETHLAPASIAVRVNPRSLRIVVPDCTRFAAAPLAPGPTTFALQLP